MPQNIKKAFKMSIITQKVNKTGGKINLPRIWRQPILTKFYAAIDGTYKFFYGYHSFVGTKHTSGEKQLKQTSSISNTGVSVP